MQLCRYLRCLRNPNRLFPCSGINLYCRAYWKSHRKTVLCETATTDVPPRLPTKTDVSAVVLLLFVTKRKYKHQETLEIPLPSPRCLNHCIGASSICASCFAARIFPVAQQASQLLLPFPEQFITSLNAPCCTRGKWLMLDLSPLIWPGGNFRPRLYI